MLQGYTASSKDGKCEKCWTDKKETHCDYKKMMTKCPKVSRVTRAQHRLQPPHTHTHTHPLLPIALVVSLTQGYDEKHYGKEYKCVKYTEEKIEGQMYYKCPRGYEQYDDVSMRSGGEQGQPDGEWNGGLGCAVCASEMHHLPHD